MPECKWRGGCCSNNALKIADQYMTTVQVLPKYLREEITFSASQKQKLVGRIMEALGTFSLTQANGGQ